jgi:transcriptional regulator with XRE-family HTH domain
MTNDYKQTVFFQRLARQLATMRKLRGLTQEQLAAEAGLDRVAIANIETGRRNPTVMTLFKLADALGVEVKDFFE